MSRQLVLVFAAVALVGATQVAFISDSQSIWKQWIAMIFSRGLYFLLALIIFFCFTVSIIRNKIDESSHGASEISWATQGTVIKSFLMPSAEIQSNRSSYLAEMSSTNTNLDVLKEAEARNKALKNELDQLNRIRLSLEERSGLLEREKAAVEDQLEETKLQSALENEALKKEAAVYQRQLQQLQEEKGLLSREVECASRESRMTDCALRDQALLTERLEATKKQVAELQKGLETLRQERDSAVAIANELATKCQGVAGESTYMIEKYVKREMERINNKEESILKQVASDTIPLSVNEGEKDDKEDNSLECSLVTLQTEGSVQWNDMIQHQGHLPCNDLVLGPVTSSEAFRNFLISSFTEE